MIYSDPQIFLYVYSILLYFIDQESLQELLNGKSVSILIFKFVCFDLIYFIKLHYIR